LDARRKRLRRIAKRRLLVLSILLILAGIITGIVTGIWALYKGFGSLALIISCTFIAAFIAWRTFRWIKDKPLRDYLDSTYWNDIIASGRNPYTAKGPPRGWWDIWYFFFGSYR
jgi:hypothetical protein